MSIRIALYQPDIPQNTGTILRLCACFGIEAHIIEPAGFPISDRAFRRAGMDYLDAVSIVRHASWSDFEAWRRQESRPNSSPNESDNQQLRQSPSGQSVSSQNQNRNQPPAPHPAQTSTQDPSLPLPRVVLFTTAASLSYLDYRFETGDILLFGRESAGVPQAVHVAADARLSIPMRSGLRSLNVAVAAAMAAGEALRQLGHRGAQD